MRKIWNSWKKITEKIGSFQIKILFSLFYFLIITPVGFITRQQDFLMERDSKKWIKVKDNTSGIKLMEKQ